MSIQTCRSWGKFYDYSGSQVSFATGSNLHPNSAGFGGELWSGVITGLLPSGAIAIEAAFDNSGSYSATVTYNSANTQWKVFLPVGANAQSGFKRWQVGSRHTISVRAIDANGYRSAATSVIFLRQLNRDINADGYADIIVGADANQGTGATDKGMAYIFYGSATGAINRPLDTTAYTCTGVTDCTAIQNPDNEATGYFGLGVALVGDVNGDGYADVVIGADRNQGSGNTDKGVGYVFYGSPTGITSHPSSSATYSCNGPPDCSVVQNPEDENLGFFGYTVSAAGDVNGDGFADVLISSDRNQGSGAADKGAAYIFYGSANGIKNHPTSATAYACNGPPDCTVMENPEDQASGSFKTLAAAGDVNGDGYADIIVGAFQNFGVGASNKGAAYIFYGSATGPIVRPLNATAYSCTGVTTCTVIQNPDNEASGNFGISVGGAGDVNSDGYADVIVGARNNQGGGATDKGGAYIFYGSANGITSHPLSASAYTCNGPPDCTLVQNPENIVTANFGISVAGVGDANGDGYADVIVGGYGNGGSGALYKGASYIYFGGAAGITSHAFSTATLSCNGPPDCTVVQNPQNTASGYFGYTVSAGGDINADGFPDVVSGAYQNQAPGIPAKGAVYINYGSATGPVVHPTDANPYNCNGPPDCSVIENPDNETVSDFGWATG